MERVATSLTRSTFTHRDPEYTKERRRKEGIVEERRRRALLSSMGVLCLEKLQRTLGVVLHEVGGERLGCIRQ